MFSKLREVLLTQYIGSILVALLVWQAAVEVVQRIVRIGFWFANRHRSASVFGGSSGSPFSWDYLIFSAVTTAMYLMTAYALARWLYPPEAPITKHETVDARSPNQSEPS